MPFETGATFGALSGHFRGTFGALSGHFRSTFGATSPRPKANINLLLGRRLHQFCCISESGGGRHTTLVHDLKSYGASNCHHSYWLFHVLSTQRTSFPTLSYWRLGYRRRNVCCKSFPACAQQSAVGGTILNMMLLSGSASCSDVCGHQGDGNESEEDSILCFANYTRVRELKFVAPAH